MHAKYFIEIQWNRNALHRELQQQQQQRQRRRRWQQSNGLCPHAFSPLPPFNLLSLLICRPTCNRPSHRSSVWHERRLRSRRRRRRRLHLKLIARWAVSRQSRRQVARLFRIATYIVFQIFFWYFFYTALSLFDDGKFDLTSCSERGNKLTSFLIVICSETIANRCSPHMTSLGYL